MVFIQPIKILAYIGEGIDVYYNKYKYLWRYKFYNGKTILLTILTLNKNLQNF